MSLLDELKEEEFECEELVSIDKLVTAYNEDKPELVAIDSESRHYHWHAPNTDPFSFQISWGKDNTYYVECLEDSELQVAEFFHSVLVDAENGKTTIVMHNTKYDLHVLQRLFRKVGIKGFPRPMYPYLQDTMIMSHVLNEQRSHGLKPLCDSYELKYSDADASFLSQQISGWIESQAQATGTKPGFNDVPNYLMVPYAVQDAYLTYALYEQFIGEMTAADPEQKDLHKIYESEMNLLWILFDAEERGMRIDLDFIHEQLAGMIPQMEVMKAECCAMLGWDSFNPGSTEQIAAALEQFGFDKSQWTNPRTGRAKLPEWVLNDIDHPIAEKILTFRTAQKISGSYFETLLKLHRVDNRGEAIIHCNFKQIGARTGRMSVTEPALQTIPREKGNVRGAFIARSGTQLIFADYSQQELRVLAHYISLWDTSMQEIFSNDGDLHYETASAIYKKPISDVTSEERRKAKNLNFAIVYGAGQKKIAEMLGVELDEAKILLRNYYNRFPGIMKLKKAAEQRMRDRGYIVTAFGRRHREKEGKFAYKAVNSLIQGSSADITKIAMLKLNRLIEERNANCRIVLSVHDEIIVESPTEEVDASIALIREAMGDFPELKVPMEVDVNVADRWSDAK